MSTVLTANERSATSLAREVLSLFKLRIGTLITITALVGYVVTPAAAGAAIGGFGVLVLALATMTASAGAGAFNQYYERFDDRLMVRTRTRAFVSGALPAYRGWLALIIAMEFAAFAACWHWVNLGAAVFVSLGAFFYAVVYTVWLKRRSWTNIVIGGLSGSFAVLAGAAASNPALGPMPWIFALILFLWTPPHFWSLAIAGREDYAAAGVPMLPVVVGNQRAANIVLYSTWALVLASLLPVFFGAGWFYLIAAAGSGGYFIHRAKQLVAKQTRATAIASFLASLVQLSAVLAAACIDVVLR